MYAGTAIINHLNYASTSNGGHVFILGFRIIFIFGGSAEQMVILV